MSTPTTLYRAFDAEGVLLYVGVARIWQLRFQAHSHTSVWMDDVATLTFAKFPTREEALKAEAFAIWNERPIFNVAGADRPSKRRDRRPLTSITFNWAKLNTERRRAGLTHLELAERSGVNCTTLLRIEAGIRVPRASTALALANALNIDVSDLWTVGERAA